MVWPLFHAVRRTKHSSGQNDDSAIIIEFGTG
ncbi:hypothetical protein RD1_4028 [Roseobacter denitrificans OCh 114]|uniref:Uncharacterized protein n=1 Tax=Roseobacter denitrificans (strain ATCC 33942 / OCh 114) TaxID=375451 RepID=Q160W8_ROSDO|nr:hypothetical protein RD1_4028 [Roseobacter denitrificans OCh 114]